MALGRLFSALPVRQGDPKDQVEVYVLALRDVTHYALDEVILQAISGQHPSLSKRFAPTTAELGEAVRDLMASVERQIALAAERLQIADNRPTMIKPKLLHDRQSEARERMNAERRKLIKSDVGSSDLRNVMRGMPVGTTYIAILGEIWGPPGSATVPDVDIPASIEPSPTGELIDDSIPW